MRMAKSGDTQQEKSKANQHDNGHRSEQRKHKRVDFFNPVKVVVPSDNTSIDVFAANVSKGGMFIRSNQPLAPGKKMRLSFSTEKGPVKVDEAEVRWAKRFEPISVDGSPPGMGVQFQRVSDDSQRNIAGFINEILAQDAPRGSTGKSDDRKTEEALPTVAPVELPLDEPAETSIQKQENKIDQAPELAQEQLGSTKTLEPTPSNELDHGSEKLMAAAFSTPPPTRTRMLLFAGFVLVVAVLTFLTLMWIKPFGQEHKATLTPKKQHKQMPIKNSETTAKATPQDKNKIHEPDHQKTSEVKKQENNVTNHEQAKDTHGESANEPHKSPASEVKASADQDKTQGKDNTGEQGKDVSPKIFAPHFSKIDSGWKMEIGATVPVHSKHFSLKSPPRLAIDIKGAIWTGQAQIENPAPFVSRIRIGKQPDHIRFVLDFNTTVVPNYKVRKKEKSLAVLFPGMK